MVKPLKDVLKKAEPTDKLRGTDSSDTVDLTLGKDPGVDYAPRTKAMRDVVADTLKIQKHADRVGNKGAPYKAPVDKYSLDDPKNKRLGRNEKESEDSYDKANPKNEKKMTAEGKNDSTYGVETPLRKVGHYTNHEHPKGKFEAKVYKDRDWNEYRVKHFINGVHQKKADYHTDDKVEAHNYAKHITSGEV